MNSRNLSPQAMFQAMAARHQPQFAFCENADFASWKREALPRVLATLGEWPERVAPRGELLAEWQHDGLRKQKWLIDVGPHIAATLLMNTPADLKDGEKRPAILCWHGHGSGGKSAVMGDEFSADAAREFKAHNYNYGHQMAKEGFVTFAIDWMAGGERRDSNKPNHLSTDMGRDWCNLYYLHATMFGMTSLSINLMHGMVATDFACSLPHVDADRLGVMGLSGGGTMTLWSALTDERLQAAEIICYSDLWAIFGIRDINYCGMQVAPGLYSLVDLPDLQGLLAPKPLLVDIGAYDSCFVVDGAMACYRKVEQIYAAAGASDKLELDLFAGEHAWGGNKSRAFFRKHLMSA